MVSPRAKVILLGGKPTLVLSNTALTAGGSAGVAIGVLSVRGGKGTYTFAITDTASSKVALNGDGVTVQTGASWPAGATTFSITCTATQGSTVITATFSISAVASYTPSLDFSDSRNSQYLPFAA